MHIIHSYRWSCCKGSVLNSIGPIVLHRAETTCMQVCYGVFYGFLFIYIVYIMFRSRLCWNTISRRALHRPDSLSRWSVKIIVAPFFTATFVAVNITAQPLSHIYPTDISECWSNPGIIWAFLDAFSNEGRFKVTVCVDEMVALFGRRTSKVVSGSTLFIHWALASRKCAVQPESKRAVDFNCGDGVQFR
jgi:hypothetical protein